MKPILVACLVAWSPIAVCNAAFTDFSDYSQNTTFAAGERFKSNGVTFSVVDRPLGPNPVMILCNPTYAALWPGPGVDFVLRYGTREVSFFYSDGASSTLAVNGVMLRPHPSKPGFSYLDGATVGGISISTTVNSADIGHEDGTLRLRGPLNRIMISGLELSIDDVLLQVPEPSAAALATLAAAALAIARRRIPPRP